MTNRILYCIFFIGLSSLFSCKKREVNSVEEYSKWINEPENGLIQTKRIKGLKVSVKYLPNEYLVYKETIGNDNTETYKDSLKKEYKNSLTFLMIIAPDEEKGNKNDIMTEGINNYQEYSERLLALNFQLDKNISLRSGTIELKPVLSALENTYGLSKSRNILFVFAANEEQKGKMNDSETIDFVYIDELFSLGIMHFDFANKKLKDLPVIGD